MAGHVEWLTADVGILRLGGAYGEPYDWACVVQRGEHGTVTLHGLAGTMTRAHWRAGMRVLSAEGFTRLRFYRRDAKGEMRRHERTIRR